MGTLKNPISRIHIVRGTVVGVLTAVIETTTRVLTERRMRALGALSKATVEAATQAGTVEDICQHLLNLLCFDNPDVPFAIKYGIDESGCARLVAASHVDPGLFPSLLSASSPDDEWGIVSVLKTRAVCTIECSELPVSLPGGCWPEPTTQLAALPLLGKKPGKLIGVMLVGVNSRLRLNTAYLDFLGLVAAELAASMSTLESIEKELRTARANELLVAELQHRTRNLLAVVQSISERTRATSTSLDHYARKFNGRLAALSRAQSLLSRDNSEAIAIGEVVRLELDALNVADFSETSTEGPIVALPRGSVQMIALALHELGTNAIKHGVLNGCGGALEIRWHRVNVDHPALRLEWSESSRESIDVIAPRTGFGRVLLEKALPAQLGAITHFDLRPNGLQCVIELPLEPTA